MSADTLHILDSKILIRAGYGVWIKRLGINCSLTEGNKNMTISFRGITLRMLSWEEGKIFGISLNTPEKEIKCHVARLD
jgi:hypothetical protein